MSIVAGILFAILSITIAENIIMVLSLGYAPHLVQILRLLGYLLLTVSLMMPRKNIIFLIGLCACALTTLLFSEGILANAMWLSAILISAACLIKKVPQCAKVARVLWPIPGLCLLVGWGLDIAAIGWADFANNYQFGDLISLLALLLSMKWVVNPINEEGKSYTCSPAMRVCAMVCFGVAAVALVACFVVASIAGGSPFWAFKGIRYGYYWFFIGIAAFVILGISFLTSKTSEIETSNEIYTEEEHGQAYCSLGKHIVLCLFTCGIWYLIWTYRTTKYLNKAPNAVQYNPTSKLLLCMFIPFYQIYWFYKHGQRIDAMSKQKKLNNSDMATLCLILGIFIPIVACILMQDRINILSTTKVVVEERKEDDSTTEQLKKYKELLDGGVISQEEFDAKKKQLLGL